MFQLYNSKGKVVYKLKDGYRIVVGIEIQIDPVSIIEIAKEASQSNRHNQSGRTFGKYPVNNPCQAADHTYFKVICHTAKHIGTVHRTQDHKRTADDAHVDQEVISWRSFFRAQVSPKYQAQQGYHCIDRNTEGVDLVVIKHFVFCDILALFTGIIQERTNHRFKVCHNDKD